MKFIKDLLTKLSSPTALGIIISLGFSIFSIQYYAQKDAIKKATDHNFLLKRIKEIDEKSTDVKLSVRGPRFGSPKVGLLTIDEHAVQAVGRWPWPRETTAKALEQAIKYGAKVISFDIVFSEPSKNKIQELYGEFNKKYKIPANLQRAFQEEVTNQDSDKQFAEFVERNAKHLVLGSFFPFPTPISNNYHDLCFALIYETAPAFQAWDREEAIIGSSEFSVGIPDSLKDIYKDHLNSIENTIKGSTAIPKSRIEAAELDRKILTKKFEYCHNWLQPKYDELYEPIKTSWDVIKEQDEFIEHETFEDWVNAVQSNLKNISLFINEWVMNTDSISQNAIHRGYFNAEQDMDGTIRQSRLVVRSDSYYKPSIALKGYLIGNNYNAEISFTQNPKNPAEKIISSLTITDGETGDTVHEIPVDGEGLLRINYAGPQKMFPYVSLAELLTDSEEMNIEQMAPEGKSYIPQYRKVKKAEFFKDMYFIVGATAIGIYDLRVTPFEENFPGAETHVNILDNLIRKDFLYSHPDEETTMIAMILLAGILLSLVIAKTGAISGLLITLLTLAGTIVFDYYYLFLSGIVTSIILPLALISILYVSLTFYKYFTEEKNKRELKSTFQKYVSPAIVDEVLKSPENLELGGKKENITVLFSDIRGFTTISEKLDPKALSDLLNSYLTPMTDLVFENRGTLDKYMGDAVMAFFGAPISYPEHPKYACRCALQMLEKLKDLQEEYRKQGLPEIDVGIGLNTGDCSVGNMGSQTVRSYTVMGDAVNLGSRLEGINKQYGTRTIISEFTYEHVKDDFLCREIDLVRVKGKILPVRIYELIAEGKVPDAIATKTSKFNEGYELYHKMEFQKALDTFTEVTNLDPEDQCAHLYIKRCQNFIDEPPPEDWDGVFVMTTK